METAQQDTSQDTMKTYANLSNGAYTSQDMSHMGYEIDKDHSNRNRTMYKHTETGKGVLAFRGTSLDSKNKWGDLGSDLLLGLGLKSLSSRFRNSSKATKKAIEAYGKENLVLTGHSLAGSQALYNNSKYGIESHAFNPGIAPSDAREGLKKKTFDKLTFGLFKKPVRKNATIYTTGSDPISLLSPLVANVNVKTVKKKKGKNSHSLEHFL